MEGKQRVLVLDDNLDMAETIGLMLARAGYECTVICESTIMVCAQVLGNDVVVATGNSWGNFELNTMMPLMAHNLLQSGALLAAASANFARQCIRGIVATERGPAAVEQGLMLTTALAPLVGYDKAAEIAKEAAKTGRTIREVARAQGEEARKRANIDSIDALARRFRETVLAEGSLIVDVVEASDRRFDFNVTRCKFVEMYDEMGARDLGYLLSCNRDFAMFEGMAPDLHFDRTQTRMEGAPHCDFRYST